MSEDFSQYLQPTFFLDFDNAEVAAFAGAVCKSEMTVMEKAIALYYAEMYVSDHWVKATPAFNLSLCSKFAVLPLEFDGIHDSMFHAHDAHGQKHMEYVRDHGHFADLPFARIFAAYGNTYPRFFEHFGGGQTFDFAIDAEQELGKSKENDLLHRLSSPSPRRWT